MNRRVIVAGLEIALAPSVLGLCLFADCTAIKGSGILAPALAEVVSTLRDPGTQWMVFVCTGAYFLAFGVLCRRVAGGGGARAGEGGGLRIEDGGTGLGEDRGLRVEDRASSVRTAWGLAAQWVEEPAFWLPGFILLGAVAYAVDYAQAVRSTEALTLVGAAMIGQGAGLWESRKQRVERRNGEGEGPKSNVQSPKPTECGVWNAEWRIAKCRSTGDEIVLALIVLLVGAAVWQAEPGHLFKYQGQARWSGPWENPNTFGMLMGVGVVLAVGRLVQSLKPKVQSRSSAECGVRTAELAEGEHPTSNIQHRTSKLVGWLKAAFFLAAAGLMGVGLVKSWSRGAWVGAAVGLAYLYLNVEGRRKNAEWGKAESRKQKAEAGEPKTEIGAARNWAAVAVMCASIAVLAFWSFRYTDKVVVRRLYSVANANDFSWRNRAAAYEGALQMMAEKPWFGFGWNQPERVYAAFYCPPKVGEAMAIQLNDYFILGTTLGIPALVCFLMYVGLALRGRRRAERPASPTLDFGLWTLDSGAVCRAGALVLLVAFWFDGGLFKLATAAPFWVLLELGRAGNHEIHEAHENE
ncbi:MAG: O-antigen ligase family protein [Limisphaerales bacterium]